jgi:hypothetical protein
MYLLRTVRQRLDNNAEVKNKKNNKIVVILIHLNYLIICPLDIVYTLPILFSIVSRLLFQAILMSS